MANRLAGKVAVITGSTSGIGRATAELFSSEGAAVVINDDGGQQRAGEEVVTGIKARGGAASYIQADVAVDTQLQHLMDAAVDQYGRLDILMNNAYHGNWGQVVDLPVEDWDRVYATTIRATFVGSKYALPHIERAGGGSIISTASVHGLLAAPGGGAYASAKAAIISLTQQLAIDYGPANIRVNAICPGRIISAADVAQPENSAKADELGPPQCYPLGRFGSFSEVATVALFLASEDASFVTGHALVVDGGMTIQLQDALVKRLETP
ncbi:MAG: glucose 1-dehydrogenase [Candidatus Latescibacteria bacterium]|nr:glucose 1-dehydrogenase [Candidatus Latescibacterota bacterium]